MGRKNELCFLECYSSSSVIQPINSHLVFRQRQDLVGFVSFGEVNIKKFLAVMLPGIKHCVNNNLLFLLHLRQGFTVYHRLALNLVCSLG